MRRQLSQPERARLSRRVKGTAERQKVCQSEIDGLLEASRSADPSERRVAINELCPCHIRRDDERVWQRVMELATDSDRGVRATVLHMLTDGSPRAREQEVIFTLERMHNDPDDKIRRGVRRVLAHYRRTGKYNVN